MGGEGQEGGEQEKQGSKCGEELGEKGKAGQTQQTPVSPLACCQPFPTHTLLAERLPCGRDYGTGDTKPSQTQALPSRNLIQWIVTSLAQNNVYDS